MKGQKDSVILHLKGGLGNQMFQYAAGRDLSLRLGVPLWLELGGLENTNRSYRLGEYAVAANIVDTRTARRWIGADWKLPLIYKVVQKLRPYYRRAIFRPATFAFDANIRRVRPPVMLDGYFQSPRYFEDHWNQIAAELTLSQPLPDSTQRMRDQICTCENAVGVHIRRGDYVTDPEVQQFHGICGLDYYMRGMEKIAAMTVAPTFFVFSDCLDWAKNLLPAVYSMVFVDCHRAESDYLDLFLLSQCTHFVLANSSFSWWGAWMAQRRGKVVAPGRWFLAPHLQTHDLILNDWVRLE